MKKCIQCKRRFDDSVITCPDCHFYLIGDFSGSAFAESEPDRETAPVRREPPRPRRRARIDPVEEPAEEHTNASAAFTPDAPDDHTDSVFTPDAGEARTGSDRGNANGGGPGSVEDNRRGDRRRVSVGPALVGLWRVARVVLPILMILGAGYFAFVHWLEIRAFLGLCGTGAVIGGVAALWLSRNSMNAFSPRVLLTGAVVGAVLACIITYNTFDINMDALAESVGTMAITLLGIYMLFRSIR